VRVWNEITLFIFHAFLKFITFWSNLSHFIPIQLSYRYQSIESWSNFYFSFLVFSIIILHILIFLVWIGLVTKVLSLDFFEQLIFVFITLFEIFEFVRVVKTIHGGIPLFLFLTFKITKFFIFFSNFPIIGLQFYSILEMVLGWIQVII